MDGLGMVARFADSVLLHLGTTRQSVLLRYANNEFSTRERPTDSVSPAEKKVLTAALPSKKLPYQIVHRVSGLGSLGRPRFAALTVSDGSLIAREIKALVPSACVWARGKRDGRIQYQAILKQVIRCPDPFLQLRKGWVVRRLAPDCTV